MTRIGNRFINEGLVQCVPSGTVNGSNLVFVLPFTPDSPESVDVFVDYMLCVSPTHYSISGATITFVTAPALGQKPFVIFAKSV